jgi:hypothetical protein
VLSSRALPAVPIATRGNVERDEERSKCGQSKNAQVCRSQPQGQNQRSVARPRLPSRPLTLHGLSLRPPVPETGGSCYLVADLEENLVELLCTTGKLDLSYAAPGIPVPVVRGRPATEAETESS